MPRTVKPLTDFKIKQAKPKEKEYNLSDGYGMQLRVKPNGSKLWLFNYIHPYTSKRTNLSIGCYPDVSLALARQERAKFRGLLAQDIDPKMHRDDQRNKRKAELKAEFERRKAEKEKEQSDKEWRQFLKEMGENA